MTIANPALKISNHKTMSLTCHEVRKPGPKEVLLHPRCTGICGTDVHFWKHNQIGDTSFKEDCVIGHESAGDVLAVGSEVKGIKPGDRVAIEPQMPCLDCHYCFLGAMNLCQSVRFLGVGTEEGCDHLLTPGAMQRYTVHDYRFVHKMPDLMTYAQGALVEPLSVAYHGLERSGVELGKGACICGAGPIGLSTLLLAKAKGATPLVITDLDEKKLEFAKSMVPEVKTYKVDPTKSIRENAAEVRKIFGSTEYEMPVSVLECTGILVSINTAAYIVRRHGVLMIIGVGKPEIDNFPFMRLSFAEIDVRFINRYVDSWPAVINLLANKVIDADKMITHTFPLEEANKALEACADPLVFTVKVQVVDDHEVEIPF